MINLRLAEVSEMEWINKSYDEVNFMHSNYDTESICIAEYNGVKAGIGRLVKIDPLNLEMGGIYVFEQFRGKGIARQIVKFLLKCIHLKQTVYCIPFENLISFYQEFGFRECKVFDNIPQKILEKTQWCQKTYKTPINLLYLKK